MGTVVTVGLDILDGECAVSLLPVGQPAPDWVAGEGFSNVGYCDDEPSNVCRRDRVPSHIAHEGGWTAMKPTGSFVFDETGVVLSAVRLLSEGELGVFVSTSKRDYLLVKTKDLTKAKAALLAAGHRFRSASEQ